FPESTEPEGEDATTLWERSVGWDHPLVIAGLWPEHLLRQAFGCSAKTFKKFADNAPSLSREVKERRWYHRETFIAWFADPGNVLASESPRTKRPAAQGKRSNRGQPGDNRKAPE